MVRFSVCSEVNLWFFFQDRIFENLFQSSGDWSEGVSNCKLSPALVPSTWLYPLTVCSRVDGSAPPPLPPPLDKTHHWLKWWPTTAHFPFQHHLIGGCWVNGRWTLSVKLLWTDSKCVCLSVWVECWVRQSCLYSRKHDEARPTSVTCRGRHSEASTTPLPRWEITF